MRALLFVFLFLCVSSVNAQNSVLAGGGNSTGTGGSISYSLGYIANLDGSSVDGTLNSGLQQPYEISVITGVKNTEINLSIKSYPNPVSNFLVINIGNTSLKNLNYNIMTLDGKVVRRGIIQSIQTTLNFTGFKNDVYVLNVYTGQQKVKSFKIIKN